MRHEYPTTPSEILQYRPVDIWEKNQKFLAAPPTDNVILSNTHGEHIVKTERSKLIASCC